MRTGHWVAVIGATALLVYARRKQRPRRILDALVEALHLHGRIGRPGAKTFDEHMAKARANNVCAPLSPDVTIEAASTKDVQTAVALAAAGERHRLWSGPAPIAVCGGGHSEHCSVDGGVVLLMHRLAEVVVDSVAKTATFGGGATFSTIFDACAAHGLAMPSGTVGSVGLGAVLCGGVGKMTRSCGLAADSILEAEIVLADGSVRTLRAGVDADAELLWAMRGCGIQLGVVTRLTVRLYALSGARHGCGRECVLALPTGVAPSAAPPAAIAAAVGVLHRAELAARAMPPAQSCDIAIGWAPPREGLPPALSMCTTPCALVGPAMDSAFSPEACAALRFDASAAPRGAYWPIPSQPLTAPASAQEAAAGDEPLQSSGAVLSYVRQIYVDELGPLGWELLTRAALRAPSPMASIVLQHGGGAARTPNGAASCLGVRNWEFSVLFIALWEPAGGESARESNMAWADAGWHALLDAGLATGTYSVDINHVRRPATADLEVALAYGEQHLARLRKIKRDVDPGCLFRSSWPLLPSGEMRQRFA